MDKPRSTVLMRTLAREYWAASRNPDEPASKAFFRSQADRDYWPRLSELCLQRVTPEFIEVVASTSFSEGAPA